MIRPVHAAMACVVLCAPAALGCTCGSDDAPGERKARPPAPAATSRPLPELLYLPEGGDIAPPAAAPRPLLPAPAAGSGRCPADMVDIMGRFCIDRYEAVMIDIATDRPFSPYYSPSPDLARRAFRQWSASTLSSVHALDLPELPSWQLDRLAAPQAVSRAGVIPQGYMSGTLALSVCRAAGKRLCSESEWDMACRGQLGRKFPYGDVYEAGRCNVFREAHAAVILHGDASTGHQDPRLNMVEHRGERLLRPTGATTACRSQWGDDAVYDMVGNLDEWVEDPKGMFAGGFFSRSTREGCDARITAHPPQYFDYSLGVRCCR